MIVDTMTWDEILKEVMADVAESNIRQRFFVIVGSKKNVYKRVALRNEQMTIFKEISILSNRKNRFYLVPFSEGKVLNAFRKAKIHARKIKKHIDSLSSNAIRRADRNKNVVNMYLQGFSIDDIYEKSGLRSRSSVFRILNEANVDLNRGRTKGPLGPRKNNGDQPKESK